MYLLPKCFMDGLCHRKVQQNKHQGSVKLKFPLQHAQAGATYSHLTFPGRPQLCPQPLSLGSVYSCPDHSNATAKVKRCTRLLLASLPFHAVLFVWIFLPWLFVWPSFFSHSRSQKSRSPGTLASHGHQKCILPILARSFSPSDHLLQFVTGFILRLI